MLDPAPHRIAERREQQQDREAHEELRQARNGRVRHAAEQPRERAERHADQQREERRAEPDLERRLAPLSSRRNSSRPSVPSEPSTNSVLSFAASASAVLRPFATCVHGPTGLSASPFANGNWSFGPCPSSVREDRVADEAEEHEQDEDDQAAERELVALEAAPEERPLAGRLEPRQRLDVGLGRDAGRSGIARRSSSPKPQSLYDGLSAVLQSFRQWFGQPGANSGSRAYGLRTCTSVTRQSLSFCFPS